MICPKCGSDRCHFISNTTTKTGSAGQGCCGYLIFGPIGLLCGFCGKDTKTKEFWVCDSCGAKFQKGGSLPSAQEAESNQNGVIKGLIGLFTDKDSSFQEKVGIFIGLLIFVVIVAVVALLFNL